MRSHSASTARSSTRRRNRRRDYRRGPEWYFLALFQLLKYFEGPLELIGTIVLPPERSRAYFFACPARPAQSRKVRRSVPVGRSRLRSFCRARGAPSLVMVEHGKRREVPRGGRLRARRGRARTPDRDGRGAADGRLRDVRERALRSCARTLFNEHCAACHTLGGSGGEEAPNLTDYKNREWLGAVIRNPRDKRFFGGTKTHHEMEAYPASAQPDDKLKAVVEYLTSLMGDDAVHVDAALAEKGKKLFADELDCNTCHEVKPGESGDGPNLSSSGSKSVGVLRPVLRDSSADDLFGKSAGMPEIRKENLEKR